MKEKDARHILITADAVGGVWQYAIDLATALTRSGHKVTLAVLGPEPSARQLEQARLLAGIDLVETGLPLDWLCKDAAPVRRAAAMLAQLARDVAADIIHCNMPSLVGAAAFPVPIVAMTHGCVATWWQAAREEPLADAYCWHREMTRKGLVAADAVAAPSASYAETVRSFYGLAARPLTVHNGRAHLPAVTPTKLPLDAALTVGRMWDPVKNAAVLDEVAGELGLPFMAAGELVGPHGETVSPAHLHALGFQSAEALSVLLALRPVFVSGALFEPFGLSVVEAARAGCALVLSDIPTFRELWDGAALFVDPTDEAAFTRAIRSLVADPLRRSTLGKIAARRAARFTPEAMAAGMAAIYARLLERPEAA